MNSNSGAAPRLAAVATAVPPHRATQAETQRFAERRFFPGLPEEDRRLLAVFETAGIETRHFCRPLEWLDSPHTFGEMNDVYIESALELSERAARGALAGAGLSPADVDHVVFVSSTGVSTPSLDAHLANRLGFRPDVRRTPLWGLGCAGGATGLSRARDLALGAPEARVLVISVELCSLTFQRGDMDRRNLVACSLFADGAAAAVIEGAGAEPRGGEAALRIVGSLSTLWPETLDVMGWDVDANGLHVVFSRDIPSIVRERVRPNLEAFLGAYGLGLNDVRHWLAHPGGPKVIAAYAEALNQPPEAFAHARDVLREFGNMSSPTCLFVLERALSAGEIAPGEYGVVSALGPGFASELVLLGRDLS